MSKENEQLRFSVDSLLLGEIGERLVTKNYIAVAELVKNAYDADATKVEVIFKNFDKRLEKKEIVIKDTGNGMNFSQIKKYWMRIATDHKLREKVSEKFGRPKTGSKGIGRFACLSLADKLVMESIGAVEDEEGKIMYYEKTKVEFNWNTYVPGTILTEIPNNYETKKLNHAKTRTTLNLIGLKKDWSKTDYNVLKRKILGLAIVSPTERKNKKPDPGFEIILKSPFEDEDNVVPLSEKILDAGWGRIIGSVSSKGVGKVSLEAKEIGYIDYEFEEKYKLLKNLKLDIAIYWDKKEYLRDTSTLALYSIEEIFEKYSGVNVFLDGFRVYPYGEPNNDWLGIDESQARRIGKVDSAFENIAEELSGVKKGRALLNQPRNQNMVGKVSIFDEDDIFKIPINREGFFENAAYSELRDFVVKCIHWMTVYYNHFLYVIRNKKLNELGEELEDIDEEFYDEEDVAVPTEVNKAFQVLDEVFKDYRKKVPSEKRTKYGKFAKTAFDLLQENALQTHKQVSIMRTLSSTGALMMVFNHDTKDLILNLNVIKDRINIIANNIKDKKYKKELYELEDILETSKLRFDNQIKMFENLTSTLYDTNKRNVVLYDVVVSAFESFKGLTNKFKINFEIDVPKKLRTGKMFEAEIYSIMINLISNAIKAIIAGYGSKIFIEAYVENNEIILNVYDDGIGISADATNIVTKPMIKDPQNRLYSVLDKRLEEEELSALGHGTGLGLNIVKEILNYYGKQFSFVDTKNWKTCARVKLPYE